MSDYPIIEQVAAIIGNRLAQDQTIVLPGIGTLYLRHRGAKKISKRAIEPPCRYVDFTSRQEGQSLPEIIATEASCDMESATRIYERWLALVQEGEQVKIVGVGTLAFKNFTMEKAFDQRLNPQGHAPIRLKSRRGFDWVTAIGVVAILFALGIGAYQFLWPTDESNPFDLLIAQFTDTPTDTAIEEPTAPTEERIETPVAQPAEQSEPSEPTVTVQSDEPQSLTSKRNYVVYGVFSTVENARKAAKSLQECHMSAAIYRFGAKFMVSPCSSDDSTICRAFMKEHQAELPNSWLYTAR